MKRLLMIAFVLLPFMANAQTSKLGMTPYVFHQAWEKVVGNTMKDAETMLKKLGYRKVGDYQREIGFNIIYAKGCNVTVSRDGVVKSAKATTSNGYANYVEIGAGIGMCYDMSITFLSKTGVNAFVELLKKSGYRFSRKDMYDMDKIDNVWERTSDGWFLMQEKNTFYIDEGPCA